MSRDDGLLLVEQQLLHTVLIRPSAVTEMPLQARHFTTEAFAELWDYITRLNLEGNPADFIVIGEAAERDGRLAIRDLAVRLACDRDLIACGNPSYQSKRVIDGWRCREAGRIADDLRSAASRREEGAVDRAISELMDLFADERECEHTAKSAMSAAWGQVMAAHEAGGALVGVPTGLSGLDDALGGLHDSDLIVVGARPAMGKTGLLLGMVLAGSIDQQGDGCPVGLISAEQPHEQVGLRWMATGSSVSVGRLRTARIEDHQWGGLTEAVKAYSDRPIRIYDRSSPDIADVARVARRWKHQFGIRALYVDYLQKLENASMAKAPRHERVGAIAKSLKDLARELRIPVIALAQVSREVEKRPDQRPLMSDLADSSEIEKEADQIMTLWRDLSSPSADCTPAEINVVKNRHGNIGRVHCLWRGAQTAFVDP